MAAAPDWWMVDDRSYRLTVASDILERDGLGLGLHDVSDPSAPVRIAEIFRDDPTGTVTWTALTHDPLPLALIESFIATARGELMLPPGL